MVCGHTFVNEDTHIMKVNHCLSHNISGEDAKVLKELKTKSKSEESPRVQQTINNTYTDCQIITNNNIIVFYGNEDFSYIQPDELMDVLTTKDAIPRLCRLMRNNPNHPENRNVKVTDMSRRKVKIFKDGVWESVNSVDTFNNMIMEASDILDTQTESGSGKFEYFHEKIDGITDKVHELDLARDKGSDTEWGKESRRDIMLQFVSP